MHCWLDPTHDHAVYRNFGDRYIYPICLRCTEVGIDTGLFKEEDLISMPERKEYGESAEG